MIKPKRLNPGSTIGIISPSYWIDNHILEQASKIFSDRNYKLVFGKTIHSKKVHSLEVPKFELKIFIQCF